MCYLCYLSPFPFPPPLTNPQHLNKTYGTNVPLVLMNSFNTQTEMDRVKHKYERVVSLHMFEQSCYPRINQETLRPLPETPTVADEE